MFSSLPANAQTINLIWSDVNGNSTTQNISASILTNGIYQIADSEIITYATEIPSANGVGVTISVQGLDVHGNAGPVALAGQVPEDAPYFVDGAST
jgi:hypothetical protein